MHQRKRGKSLLGAFPILLLTFLLRFVVDAGNRSHQLRNKFKPQFPIDKIKRNLLMEGLAAWLKITATGSRMNRNGTRAEQIRSWKIVLCSGWVSIRS
jgi:hypothetical protein